MPCANITNKLITTDNTIPEVYRQTFNKLCSKDTFWKYLAHIFIFAVMRDTNTKIKELEEREKNKEKIHPLIERVICELAIYGKSETFESTLDFIDMSLMHAKTVEDCPIGGADLVALYKGAVEYKEWDIILMCNILCRFTSIKTLYKCLFLRFT